MGCGGVVNVGLRVKCRQYDTKYQINVLKSMINGYKKQ